MPTHSHSTRFHHRDKMSDYYNLLAQDTEREERHAIRRMKDLPSDTEDEESENLLGDTSDSEATIPPPPGEEKEVTNWAAEVDAAEESASKSSVYQNSFFDYLPVFLSNKLKLHREVKVKKTINIEVESAVVDQNTLDFEMYLSRKNRRLLLNGKPTIKKNRRHKIKYVKKVLHKQTSKILST